MRGCFNVVNYRLFSFSAQSAAPHADSVSGTSFEVAVCKHALLESSPPAPRFAVGARVECCVDDDLWVKATVVNHYYHQPGTPPDLFHPYQIKLERGGSARTEEGGIATWNGRLIFAPLDTDNCIRAFRRASRG